MTADRDIERLLDAWFADGPMQVSDRAFDEAVGRVHRQRQRPAWRLLWKEPRMSAPLKAVLGAAAIVVVVVAGFMAFGRSSQPNGVGGAPTAIPSPTPTPSPSPTQSPKALTSGPLTAGTYVTYPFPRPDDGLRIGFTVPSGWSGFPSWGLLGPSSSPDGVGLGFLMASGLFTDGCHWDQVGDGTFPQRGDITVGPTVDDLVVAFIAHPAYKATAPVDAQVGGYPAKRLDLTLPTDVDLSKCDNVSGGSGGAFFVWGTTDPSGNDLYAQGPGQRYHLWIVDADGTRILIVNNDYAGSLDTDRAQAQAIIDSVTISR